MAAGRRAALGRPSSPANTAFINVPYDAEYEDVYLAFIAGLTGFGLIPHATLEIPGSTRRLDRIVRLLRRCRYSFHDLSRVQVDTAPPPTPRFNMPFELGIAVALAKLRQRPHDWFVFEARAHRLGKSLSDLGGTDEYVHGGTPRGVLRALANALVRRRYRPTVAELETIYEELRAAAVEIKRTLRADSLFEARAFRELVVTARMSERRLAAGRRHGRRRRR